jgi:S-adenosylmethionine hydrolase
MITLTSDFGFKDSYVAQMKGTILTINPKATIVDITHDVEKFNVRMGAFILASAASFFPKGTVHLVVVDPGVGTERRAIVIQTKKALFVGPDNGVLMLAAEKMGIEHTYQLANPKFRPQKISNTFHGRDIFAPAAAYLDNGVEPSEVGPEIEEAVEPKFVIVKNKDNIIKGEILHIDGFGNLITNITMQAASIKEICVNLQNQTFTLPFCKTYGQMQAKQSIALVGSHGFLEIAINQGNAAHKFQVKVGDTVEVGFRT